MKTQLKAFANLISPNLGRSLRNFRQSRVLTASPQLTPEGRRFWGTQRYNDYEPPIFRVLDQLMSRADAFVNVGANHGVYCLKFVDKARTVFAVEALAHNLRFLYKNVRENGLQERIFVLPVAAGSKPMLGTFYGADTGGSLLKGWNQQVDTGVDVPIFPLDMLLQTGLEGTRPLFLIDVEGAELEVVKGASRLIDTLEGAVYCVEIPCVEFMPDGIFNPAFVDTFEFFFDKGFLAYEITPQGALSPLNREQVRAYRDTRRFEGVMGVFAREPVTLG